MHQSLFKVYKKEIIFFYACAAVSLIVASFADLKIDIFLNNPSSVISNWFEQTGEMPSMILITIAMAFIMKCASLKWVRIVAGVCCFAGGGYFGYWLGGRLFAENNFRDAFGVIFGFIFAALVVFVMRFISVPENAKRSILIIAFVGLIAGAIGTVLIGSMKGVWGRVRFRSMEAPYTDFTPWYIINGNNGNHSFPSGHTAGAGVSYQLMLLPFVSSNCLKHKTALFFMAYVFTSAVAFTRLVMGAHYLSDVTIGGTISFTCTLIGIALYEKFGSRFAAE